MINIADQHLSFHEKNLQKIAPESEQKMEKIKTFVIKRGGEEESHLPFSNFQLFFNHPESLLDSRNAFCILFGLSLREPVKNVLADFVR